MKTTFRFFFAFCVSIAGAAPAFSQTTTTTAEAGAAVATSDEMEQLVAPIALYPDVLVALILPAAIESSDVVLAARFLEKGGAEAQIEGQPWDNSVKGLARYPDVVKWMDENLSWTRQLGDAYLDKPEEVMAAIQRVRARAKAQGLLASTAEQEVVAEGEYIRIVPAQPNVVYVPRYDPEIIFVERPVIYRTDPWITFGVGFGVGWWLGYDCDWRRRVIVVNPSYRHHWRHHHDWRHHRFVHHHRFHHDWKPWTPSHRRHHHHRNHHNHFNRPGREIARPTPHHGAPRHDWSRRWDRREHGARPHGNRDGQRNHFGRDGQQRREIGAPPAASNWRAGARNPGIQQTPAGAPQVRQRNEERREWRRDRERDGNRGPGQRREFAPNAPRVVGAPPAGTLRQQQHAAAPSARPQINQRPEMRQRPEAGQRRDWRPRPEGQSRQHVQQRPERVQAPRHFAERAPRAVAPRVAAAPAPRAVPAPERRASIGSDAGARSAPRFSAPSAGRGSASGDVRGGHRGEGGRHGGRGRGAER